MDRLRLVHLTGSPTSERWAELSRLYARGALDALAAAGPSRSGAWDHVVVDVDPAGHWRFPVSLADDDLASADPVDRATGLARLAELDADVGVPQMFCPAGLVDHRSLLALLGIPSIGNSATVMAMTADKSVARAVVAAAGVDVPAAVLVRRGERAPAFERPVVVKPVDADNSTGVELVERTSELAPAIAAALDLSDAALVEDFVPLGREVRCGTIRRDGHVMALPLEEYAVDPVHAPIRREHDKLADDGDGLRLVAKNDTRAWIVPDATPDATDGDRDPVTAAVQDMALTVHRALGCSHHGLIDVRIDPSGRPWFLEAGPYCSFAPSSVVVMMAAAAGIDLAELFSDAVDVALDRTPIGASR